MARKNLLAGLTEEGDAPGEAVSYPVRGASKSMIRSIDELARQAEKLLEGETVVELDPATIDGSFVTDRLGEDAESFDALLAAIGTQGQTSPVLVRPHPETPERYQAVFGHRRIRVASVLGRPVRAVIKAMDDRAHVIAQGQENSARANLSFIERALFAARLDGLGYDREIIMASLAANAAALSKMLTTVARIPQSVILAIGPAPSVGRERWVELSLLAGKAGKAIEAVIARPGFAGMDSDARFAAIFTAVNKTAKPVKKAVLRPEGRRWAPADKRVAAEIHASAKVFTLSLTAKDGRPFGQFLSDHLDEFYRQFRALEGEERG